VSRDRSENKAMRDARFFGSALLVLALTACAAPVVDDGGGSPARLILDPSVTRRNPAAGILTVRREAATAGECRHRIFLDGTPVADLRPNEVINIYAAPGRHVLRAERTGSSCHGGNEVPAISERGKGRLFVTTDPSPKGVLLTATNQ
jgi:hypothetical protein